MNFGVIFCAPHFDRRLPFKMRKRKSAEKTQFLSVRIVLFTLHCRWGIAPRPRRFVLYILCQNQAFVNSNKQNCRLRQNYQGQSDHKMHMLCLMSDLKHCKIHTNSAADKTYREKKFFTYPPTAAPCLMLIIYADRRRNNINGNHINRKYGNHPVCSVVTSFYQKIFYTATVKLPIANF